MNPQLIVRFMYASLKPYSYLLVFVFLSYSCSDTEEKAVNSFNQQPILNIGHGGSGFNYLLNPFNPLPTNSMASLKKALENGADGVEVDLQISADNQLILYHDLNLESNTSLQGLIPFTSSKEIIGTDYVCGFPYDLFQNEKVISLQSWLDYAVTLPEIPYLQVDIKISEGQSDQSILSLLRELNESLLKCNYPLNKVICISLSPIILDHLHQINSKLIRAIENYNTEESIKWAIENNYEYIIADMKRLNANLVGEAHSHGIGVIATGGKSKSTLKKIIQMKPVFIQSNNVKLLEKLLN